MSLKNRLLKKFPVMIQTFWNWVRKRKSFQAWTYMRFLVPILEWKKKLKTTLHGTRTEKHSYRFSPVCRWGVNCTW